MIHTEMELFDTYFVWFGQVLTVSGQKTLATSNRYLQVVKSQPYLRLFSEHSAQKSKNKHQIMNEHTKWNCLIPILFSLVKY